MMQAATTRCEVINKQDIIYTHLAESPPKEI